MEMFAKKAAGEKPCNTIDTLIGAKTEIKGDIVFSGGLRIDGKVKGSVSAREAGSTLVLSENGAITGNVSVPHMIVNGAIKGNVRSAERIELQPKADITGDVTYKTIEMALGAAINGNLIREPAADKSAVAVTKLKSVAAGPELE